MKIEEQEYNFDESNTNLKENNIINFREDDKDPQQYFCTKILIIIILYIIYNKITSFQELHKYCSICAKKLNSKCRKCNNEILFQDLNVISTGETLNEIIEYNKSISRFGDGEYFIIYGNGIKFQEYNITLAKRLFEIIRNNNEDKNLLVGIYFPYKKKELNLYRESEIQYWTKFFKYDRIKLLRILDLNKTYYSSDITRFYHKYKNKSHIPDYIKKLKKIWEKRDILIVEGEKTRMGIGNDLFNNSKSIKRIICPAKHAFRVYDKILNAVLTVDKNILVLISLGPTATVLACDLSKLGYQALDIGHMDIQYELFLRNATDMIQIPYKFVNEYNGGKNESVEEIKDENYYNQIIYKIF